MTNDGIVTMPRSGKTFQQITCDTPHCESYRVTTSDESLLNGSIIAAWNLPVRYNVRSGKVVARG